MENRPWSIAAMKQRSISMDLLPTAMERAYRGGETIPPPPPRKKVPPAKEEKAAVDFCDRHRTSYGKARLMLEATWDDPSSDAKPRNFESFLWEVRRNRLFVPEEIEKEKRKKPPVRRKAITPMTPKLQRVPTWNIRNSIWNPRRRYCDSKAFYDTEDCERAMLKRDWDLARTSQGLEKYIRRMDDDGAVNQEGPDEVDEVYHVLHENRHLIYATFDYYASIGTSSDIFHIDLNAYYLFLEQCRLVVDHSKYSQRSHLDQLFVLVNAGHHENREDDKFNKKAACNRQEFIQLLVRIAVMRYTSHRRRHVVPPRGAAHDVLLDRARGMSTWQVHPHR